MGQNISFDIIPKVFRNNNIINKSLAEKMNYLFFDKNTLKN